MVALPATVVFDVFHCQWPGLAVLYRAVFATWLRQLHARPCWAPILAGNLERARLSGLSCGAAFGQAAQELRQLRLALEPVNEVTVVSAVKAEPSAKRSAVVSAVIPCLNEETTIAGVVTAVLAEGIDEVIVVDGGSRIVPLERARSAAPT